MFKVVSGFSVILGFLVSSHNIAFAKFDGSVPLLCVPIEIVECEAGGKCYDGTAEDVNLPQFIRINFKDKTLSAVGEPGRTAPINHFERNNGRLILHGGQNGRGWTAIISEETGRLSATISEERLGFIIFGACTAL